jgi:hypothetical protein
MDVSRSGLFIINIVIPRLENNNTLNLDGFSISKDTERAFSGEAKSHTNKSRFVLCGRNYEYSFKGTFTIKYT